MPKILPAVLTLAYPFLVYAAIDQVEARSLALGLLALFLLRWRNPGNAGGKARLFAVAGCGFFLAVALSNDRLLLLGYPVLVSMLFLGLFAYSLIYPPTVAERLARLKEPDLPPQGIVYTRKVTWVWCGFFLVNGLIAAATVWHGDKGVWSLYNGFISYLLMGILMGGEILVRNQVKKAFYHDGN
jgi:uncharacterized membrane protein